MVDSRKRFQIAGDLVTLAAIRARLKNGSDAHGRVEHHPEAAELDLLARPIDGNSAIQFADRAVEVPEHANSRQGFPSALFVFIGRVYAYAEERDLVVVKERPVLADNVEHCPTIMIRAAAEKA